MNQPSPLSSPLNQAWETYTAAWKANTDAARQAWFAQSLDQQCEYNDQGKLLATTGFFATA